MRRAAALIAFLLLTTLALAAPTGCGSSTTSCLAAGTLVATPAGEVPIESLRLGDVVYSVDPLDGRLHPARLAAVRSARRPCLALTTASGRVVVATAEHPIYDPERRRYVPAGEWLDGRRSPIGLHERGLRPDPITACREVPGVRTVYDLTVDSPFHNFLANGVLVHNKSQPLEDLGPIEAAVAIEDVASATQAVPAPQSNETWSDVGLPIQLRVDPVALGPGIVRVTASQPFDALLFMAQADGGMFAGVLLLVPPAAGMSFDIRVTAPTVQGPLFLTVWARAAGVFGPSESTYVP